VLDLAVEPETPADRLAQIEATLETIRQTMPPGEAVASLADSLQTMVAHMRSEQQMLRDWVAAQAARDQEMKTFLARALEGLKK
jgi:uncharacterized protein (DUF2267 family)